MDMHAHLLLWNIKLIISKKSNELELANFTGPFLENVKGIR
jgi:hypothetical protein